MPWNRFPLTNLVRWPSHCVYVCTQKVLYGAPRHLSFLKFPWQPSEPDGLQMTKHAYEWKANCWTRRGFHTRLFISSNAFHHGKSTAFKKVFTLRQSLIFWIEFQCGHNNWIANVFTSRLSCCCHAFQWKVTFYHPSRTFPPAFTRRSLRHRNS